MSNTQKESIRIEIYNRDSLNREKTQTDEMQRIDTLSEEKQEKSSTRIYIKRKNKDKDHQIKIEINEPVSNSPRKHPKKHKYQSKSKLTIKSDEDKDKAKRYDAFGVEIKKGGKHRISFMDKLNKKERKGLRKKLTDVIDIESFKEYNIDMTTSTINVARRRGCCAKCGGCNVF